MDPMMLGCGKSMIVIGSLVMKERLHVVHKLISIVLLRFINQVETVGEHGLPLEDVDVD